MSQDDEAASAMIWCGLSIPEWNRLNLKIRADIVAQHQGACVEAFGRLQAPQTSVPDEVEILRLANAVQAVKLAGAQREIGALTDIVRWLRARHVSRERELLGLKCVNVRLTESNDALRAADLAARQREYEHMLTLLDRPDDGGKALFPSRRADDHMVSDGHEVVELRATLADLGFAGFEDDPAEQPQPQAEKPPKPHAKALPATALRCHDDGPLTR